MFVTRFSESRIDEFQSNMGEHTVGPHMEHTSISNSVAANHGMSAENVVEKLHSELNQLLQQRAEVMRHIATAKKTIVGLASLFGENVLSPELQTLVGVGEANRKPGLTKACRLILIESRGPLSARNVVDALQHQDPEILAGHKDPIASVTTILNRLADYKEVERVVLSNGKRGWRWAEETESSLQA